MFFSFKEVETIKGVKLSLALLCGLVFLFVCMPTALGCAADIKPGSYPNSINVNNNGVITIALQDEGFPPEAVELYLYKDGKFVTTEPYRVSYKYEYVDNLVIDPTLKGEESEDYYAGPGYILKFRTQDLYDLFYDHFDEENLSLYIRWVRDGNSYAGIDSVRLINNK